MLGSVAKWVTVGVKVDASEVSVGLQKAANDTEAAARRMAQNIEASGVRMVASFAATVLAAAGVSRALSAVIEGAKEYEQGIISLRAVTSANTTELANAEGAIRRVSLEFGTGTAAATEAATELAKAGVSIEDLADGALSAAVVMAKATGGTYADGATIAAKATQVFRLEVTDMSKVVQGASGVINSTTFSLSDYTQALQQGGAAARNAGLNFQDFNTILALTATALGTTGSDTGTSVRTFLSRLVPQSKEAASVMRQLGLTFYDANGKFVGLAQAAQRLQDALGGLSDEQRNYALVTMFGTDAQRQAIALMEAGAAGVEAYNAKVQDSANAAEMARTRTEGFAGATNNLKAAFDDLGASISKSGLMELLAALTNYAAGGVRDLSVGVQGFSSNGLGAIWGAQGDAAVRDLATLGVEMQKKAGRSTSWGRGDLDVSTVGAGQYAASHMSAKDLAAYLEQNATGTNTARNTTYVGKLLYEKALKQAQDEFLKSLPTVNLNDLALPKPKAKPGDGDLTDISAITIKKIGKTISEADMKLKFPRDVVNATSLMRANSEALLRSAEKMQKALQPIIDIVDDIKASVENAIVEGDWSSIGKVFSTALKRVLYQSVMKDLVDSFGDMLERVFAIIFQRLSRSQSKGFDDLLGGAFDAIVGGVSAVAGSTSTALAAAGHTAATSINVVVHAQDAVLTSTVKGWVAQGAAQGVQVARGMSANDAARASLTRLR